MKYNSFLMAFIMLLALSTNSFAVIEGKNYGSFYKQRPDNIQEEIDSLFTKLSNHSYSSWDQNGDAKYRICGIDDEKLILEIIKQAPKEQEEFYFVDVGAGRYQWVDNVFNFLKNHTEVLKIKNTTSSV